MRGAERPLAFRHGLAACLALALLGCGGGGSGGEVDGPPDRRIEVDAVSYAYHPTQIRVEPGTIRFVVRNSGNQVHGFEVEGHGLIEEIPAGQADSLTVTLSGAGESRIYCPVEDHEERGMVGTLTVASEPRGRGAGRPRRRP